MDLSYRVYRCQRDQKPESHFHENYEILLALNNDGTFFVREKSYQLQYGTAFILNQFEIHHCFCTGPQDYDRYIIQFSGETLADVSTRHTDLISLFNNSPLTVSFPAETLQEMLSILNRLASPPSDSFGEDIHRNICFERLLLIIAQAIKNCISIPLLEFNRTDRLDSILKYIHANFNKQISLDTITKEFFLSKSRVNQIFRSATGFSIGDYIITYRITRACKLLKQGVPAQEVSKMVGFKGYTHFMRTFKKKTGFSPGEFIKG
ncbi:HTH-type transcriptional activator RhaR [bioreactor metagenome]|uniref:HTH-type transcriptional activator RhaR n=1 Tax=bioreactor metagenome TaxID=1076179 RepID=A0A644WWF5_9ZZZZ